MSRPVRHADLVARALGQLAGAELERVDAALEQSATLRQQFEEIAGHLLQYDNLPPAPSAPAFERLANALDADTARDTSAADLGVLRLQSAEHPAPRLTLRPWIAAAAAAAVLVALFVWRPWQPDGQGGPGLHVVAGRGLTLVRDGVALPTPAHARLAIQAGDVLRCEAAAEARLGERVRLVLDGGGSLRIDANDAVTLERGRAWFEVTPGAFEVRTTHGPVRVLGTAFEVDVREEALVVAVGHGRVAASGVEIRTGERLEGGVVHADARPAGAWFRRPALRLEHDGQSPHPLGTELSLRVVFHNPGQVPLVLPGPSAGRTALWISFETESGRILRELPVLEANVIRGRDLLREGAGVALEAGSQRALTLKILPPVGSPGAYRCRALYRPAGQPGVLSTPLDVEVR